MNTQGQITVRQWFRLPKDERQRRVTEFREADEALQVNGDIEQAAGIGWETDKYLRLNGTVNDLWPTVPWWVRAPALPHPGSRRGAAGYALAAVVALVATVLIALMLAGCGRPACSGHGGVQIRSASWTYCHDGTVEPG